MLISFSPVSPWPGDCAHLCWASKHAKWHAACATHDVRLSQVWFDRGLVWCYGYNHEESVRCFRKAAECDPSCAMAYWGVSYAAGPNYNKQWKAFDPIDLRRSLDTAHDAVGRALELVDGANSVEQALI